MANKPAISTGGSPMKRLYHFAKSFLSVGRSHSNRSISTGGQSRNQLRSRNGRGVWVDILFRYPVALMIQSPTNTEPAQAQG